MPNRALSWQLGGVLFLPGFFLHGFFDGREGDKEPFLGLGPLPEPVFGLKIKAGRCEESVEQFFQFRAVDAYFNGNYQKNETLNYIGNSRSSSP